MLSNKDRVLIKMLFFKKDMVDKDYCLDFQDKLTSCFCEPLCCTGLMHVGLQTANSAVVSDENIRILKRMNQRHTELWAKCVCAESGHFDRL